MNDESAEIGAQLERLELASAELVREMEALLAVTRSLVEATAELVAQLENEK